VNANPSLAKSTSGVRGFMTRNYTAVAHGAELVETADIRENLYEYKSRYIAD
jgi:hypothetical protein